MAKAKKNYKLKMKNGIMCYQLPVHEDVTVMKRFCAKKARFKKMGIFKTSVRQPSRFHCFRGAANIRLVCR